MGAQAQDAVLSFKDGSTAAVHIGLREIVEMERHWKRGTHITQRPDGTVESSTTEIPALESTLYGAWVALGRPLDFDSWLDTVETIKDAKSVDEDPSPPAAGDA